MEAIKFKTLTTENEIEKYLGKFEGFVGVKLPYDYSMRSKMIGVFKGEEMVGGYMLVTKPEFRSLMFVPDSVKAQHEFFKNDQYEMMEVNGVWISVTLKSAIDYFRIWIHMMWDVFMTRKNYVLLMADLRNGNVKNIHNLTSPELLYEGPPMLMAGSQSHSTIRVSYTTRWQMVLNIPRYWMEYKNREKRFNRRLKERAYSRELRQAEL
ncbi:MAG: hypothetical protein Q8L60_01630 [Gammaproteobacteria bacterium]|nr:hypothetical protein [Gammaproteobacteria bacterium]MDP2141923.1 hypothetical protein [Gammaproteobacteria bacterium]MDP2347195.1 hypothetical protein [Gammaproteobacteria bacterium]